jgi:hypothetical protein
VGLSQKVGTLIADRRTRAKFNGHFTDSRKRENGRRLAERGEFAFSGDDRFPISPFDEESVSRSQRSLEKPQRKW